MRAPESVLLVEGTDDFHVVKNLLRARIPDHRFEPKDKGGIDNLLATLHVELRASDLRRLGVVVDADESVGSRWQSISSTLVKEGYLGAPQVPDSAGTIVTQPDKPAVGIWIMPDNRTSGMLEDFATALIPDGDDLLTLVRHSVDAIPAGSRRFSPAHRAKAEIHTRLAWQEEPGRPMGLAITNTYLDHNASLANVFVDWARKLLGENKVQQL